MAPIMKKIYNKSKKFTRPVKKTFRKRYLREDNTMKYNRLYKDVMTLKNMVNAEKKNADTTDTAVYQLAQYAGALTGSQSILITPTIAQGASEDQRNGDSIKVCSMVLQIQVKNNASLTLQDMNYKFYIVRQPINPVATGTVPSVLLQPSVFSGVIDYNSNRDYQNFQDLEVMGVIKGSLKYNSNSAVGMYSSKNHLFARKFDFHIRYDKGTTTIINNPIYLVAVCDSGDRSGTNEITFQYSNKLYFYDN